MSSPLPTVAVGEATDVVTNVGPGFELLALAVAGVAHRVEARAAADPAQPRTRAARDGAEPEALHAARRAFDDVAAHLGVVTPFDLRVDARRSVRRGHGGVTPVAAAAARAATQLVEARPASDALVRAVADAERRAFGLPRPAAARAALCGGLAVTTEVHPPSAASWRTAPWWLCIVAPDVALRPHALKAALPNHVPLMKAMRHAARTHALLHALHDGDADAARAAFSDAIVEPVLGHLFTGAHPALHGARRAGALGAWMTGAGPDLCALTTDQSAARAAADAMTAALDAHCVSSTFEVAPLAPLRPLDAR